MSVADYHPLRPVAAPAETYRALRETCPVHRAEEGGVTLYTISRHEDVRRMMRDERSWAAGFGQGPFATLEPGIRNDGREHATYRRLLNRVLAANVVARREPTVRAEVDRIIDALPTDGGCDLLDDIAAVLPRRVFSPVLGVSADQLDALWRPTWETLTARDTSDHGRPEPWDATKARPAWQAAHALIAPLVAARRDRGGEDLLSVLAAARDDAGVPLPDDALTHVVMLVLFGAVHSAATMLANAVVRLLESGGWQALRDDPALAAAAVEESVRFDPPVPGIFRAARGEQCLHGVTIPAGAKARALFAAANRDPAAFEAPDDFRLDRDPTPAARRHMSFGFGVHLCVGAPLARLEGRALLAGLARRLPGLRLAGAHRWWDERHAITQLEPHRLLPVRW